MKTVIEAIGEYNRFGSILGLERMEALLGKLGNPEENLKVIHVGGTNGKGSVSMYIYEALQAEGYKVGLFTSPYIESFNERIQFNGMEIDDESLEKYGNQVLKAGREMVDEGLDSPTEFEIVTAIGLVYFAMEKADLVVLEVGLGGRGDSTNVIKKPVITVITSIGMDHTDRLGPKITDIAWEKAGIIKEGCPVVINVEDREPAKVIAKEAYSKGAVLYDVSKIKYHRAIPSQEGEVFGTEIYGTEFGNIRLSMVGEHQIGNCITALATIEILRKNGIINMSKIALYDGLAKAVQKGRFEIIKRPKTYVLDGAHNLDGMEALVKAVDDVFYGQRVLTVIGMLGDKDVESMVEMASHLGDFFIVTEPDSDRRLSGETLGQLFKDRGKDFITTSRGEDALEKAKEIEADYDLVLCVGSLYLIGELRRILNG